MTIPVKLVSEKNPTNVFLVTTDTSENSTPKKALVTVKPVIKMMTKLFVTELLVIPTNTSIKKTTFVMIVTTLVTPVPEKNPPTVNLVTPLKTDGSTKTKKLVPVKTCTKKMTKKNVSTLLNKEKSPSTSISEK